MSTTKFKNSAMYTYSPSYTFPGNLPEEIFIRPTIGTPALSDFAQVRQGIRTNEYLILLPEISKVLTPSTGCAPNYGNAGSFSDRKITVAEWDIAQQWCKSDWESTASVLTNDPTWMANGMDGFQLTKKLSDYLVGATLDAARRDMWRYLFFGNTAATDPSYARINGVFVNLINANSGYCVKMVGNDLPNSTLSSLAADQAYNALKATHTGAAIPLKQISASEKVFWVNGAMYENLLQSYESKTNGATELQFKMILNGVGTGIGVGDGQGGNPFGSFDGGVLTYRGIPVVPLYFADDSLTDPANPWYGNLANFVIYTTRGSSKYANQVIGTENAADLNRIDLWYDGRLRTMFLQGNMRFGYNFINCNLTAIYI